jgi:hypothetical protein
VLELELVASELSLEAEVLELDESVLAGATLEVLDSGLPPQEANSINALLTSKSFFPVIVLFSFFFNGRDP